MKLYKALVKGFEGDTWRLRTQIRAVNLTQAIHILTNELYGADARAVGRRGKDPHWTVQVRLWVQNQAVHTSYKIVQGGVVRAFPFFDYNSVIDSKPDREENHDIHHERQKQIS